MINKLNDINEIANFLKNDSSFLGEGTFENESKHHAVLCYCSERTINKCINEINYANMEGDIKEGEVNLFLESGDAICLIKVVRSHILIPESIIKKFFKNGKASCLSNDKIININGMYNSQLGYYSIKFEDLLGKQYEKPLGDLIKDLAKFYNKKIESLNINTKLILDLFTIFYYRNPKNINNLNKRSIFNKIFVYTTEGLISSFPIENISIFKELMPSVIFNKTQEDLILPGSMMFDMEYNGKPLILLTLTPKISLCLFKIEDRYFYFGNTGECYFTIDDEDIEYFNLAAFIYAKKFDYDVIGNRNVLEKYQNKYIMLTNNDLK